LTGRVNGDQNDGEKNGEDADDYEKFYEGKTFFVIHKLAGN
jgi:hypothetical protein